MRFIRTVHALGRVCRLWHQLSQELAYQTVRLDTRRWKSLCAAMDDTERSVAPWIRSMMLSTTRFDHNMQMLQQPAFCDTLEAVLQPEFPRNEAIYAPEKGVVLPPLRNLRWIFWVDTHWSHSSLESVLAASAPNIQHIVLASSRTIGPESNRDRIRIPSTGLPRLETLAIERVTGLQADTILGARLPNLTELTLHPMHLLMTPQAYDPILSLRTLTLIDRPISKVYISCTAIRARFPALKELRFDACSTFRLPEKPFTHLVCVHLLLPAEPPLNVFPAIANLPLMRDHPTFAALERVVLSGKGWGYLRHPKMKTELKEVEDMKAAKGNGREIRVESRDGREWTLDRIG
ncbi:hypothetical protein HMN09_00344800 [Mycena chlorophos]|uniref:Uncharacterized protein n=1 Tax=Mycena chlorophos TaxID=658473 RepID=A0A8H6TIU5_MYCCL|nr:hypothetical protein HMN09_00344800 [Mycena chlorophos]